MGIWCCSREIAGVPTVVRVDLLVPAALGGGGQLAARIPGQEKGSILKVAGLEGCLVDSAPHNIRALEPGDERSFEIMVTGPASLLVAKAFELKERQEAATKTRECRENKDALDVLRLLGAVPVSVLAQGLQRLRQSETARGVTETAIAALVPLFGRADSPASLMAVGAAGPGEASEVVAASCAALVAELPEALRGGPGES